MNDEKWVPPIGSIELTGKVVRAMSHGGFYQDVTDDDRLFREHLALALGVSGHPKEKTLYEMAYRQGHDEGCGAIAEIYSDLVTLIQND